MEVNTQHGHSLVIWGCMNKDGQIIIKAKYDCFKIKDNFILAGRNGEMLYHDNHSNATDYSGVYDLYSSSGELIFGGFSDFQYNKEKKLFILFKVKLKLMVIIQKVQQINHNH